MSQTYSKTALGTQEMATRKLNLAPGLRNALILVDKSRAVEKLKRDAQRIGSPDDFIEQLLALGLIVANAGSLDNQALGANDSAAEKKPAITQSVPTRSIPIPTQIISEFNLKEAQRYLVKLIEKTLGPSGERIALSVESTKTENEFLLAATKTKTILTSVNASVANDPLWTMLDL
jgi:hypothetical protein